MRRTSSQGPSSSHKHISQPTAADDGSPPAKHKRHPASINLDSLKIGNIGFRRSSSPAVTTPPTTDITSPDIADDDGLTPTLSSAVSWGFGRAKTLPKMTMRRTTSLEADLQLPPLMIEKVVKMRRWIVSLAIVNFDLDVGPVIDVLFPEIEMTDSERENIAFSSFPDSAIFESGSQVHSFRIRCPASLHSLSNNDFALTSDEFLYGFTLFHQRKDASSKRGYLQRSVVILTRHSYPSLFTACLAELGPMYFARGASALETACHNISNWPEPSPGLACEVGFMGAVLTIELPLDTRHYQLRQRSALSLSLPTEIAAPILVSLPSSIFALPSPLRLFAQLLPKMWSLWECLVLCEPVVIFAKSPRDASLAVWWLIELLKPLPPAIDFRPYFHIHDMDLDRLIGPNSYTSHLSAAPAPPLPSNASTSSASSAAPRGVLIGVTNPFFENLCKGWPHLISLGNIVVPMAAQSLTIEDESNSISKEGKRASPGKAGLKPSPGRTSSHIRRASSSNALPKAGGGAVQLGPTPGFHSKHQRFISKDRELLKVLEHAVGRGEASEIRAVLQLRQHFARRASEVLVPLNRYFASLLPRASSTFSSTTASRAPSLAPPSSSPSSRSTSPSRGSKLAPFLPSEFLASLKQHGSPLPFRTRGKQKEFYERWLKSPAFGMWLRERDEEVRRILGGA